MKLINTFNTFSTISGNAATGYPLTNLATLDTNQIWKGTSNSETITIDFGSAKPVSGIFLNNANFTSAVITASNNSSFTDGVTLNLTLKADDLGIIKGFGSVSSANYRYLRVVCSSLISGSTVCQLGNLIVGKAENIKVASWSSDIVDKIKSFESDGGSYRTKKTGQSRHTFGVGFTDVKAVIDNLPLDFDAGVIFTDLNDVADSYLIGRPTQRRKQVNNPLDCSLNLNLEELI
jgi:hypothetical protein